MIIELKILNDLAEERVGKDEDGEEYTYTKVIKKNIITKKLINTNSISSIAETLTKKGVPYKSRCIIYIKEELNLNDYFINLFLSRNKLAFIYLFGSSNCILS